MATELFPWRVTTLGRRKITDDEVRLIRRLALTQTYAQIQREGFVGVARETIARIARRETHAHVPDHAQAPRTAAEADTMVERSLERLQELLREEERKDALAAEVLDELTGDRGVPKNPLEEKGDET